MIKGPGKTESAARKSQRRRGQAAPETWDVYALRRDTPRLAGPRHAYGRAAPGPAVEIPADKSVVAGGRHSHFHYASPDRSKQAVTAIGGSDSAVHLHCLDGLAYVWGGKAVCAGARGIAIAKTGDHAKAANIAAVYEAGSAFVTDTGVAIAVNRPGEFSAKVKGVLHSVLVVGFQAFIEAPPPVPGASRKTYFVAKVVDGKKIKPLTWYKLSANRKTLVPA